VFAVAADFELTGETGRRGLQGQVGLRDWGGEAVVLAVLFGARTGGYTVQRNA